MLFILKEEEPWKLSDDVYKLNPAGELPIFLSDGNVVVGNYAITEYLEETGSEAPMISGDAKQRAEIRRITEWFDNKFTKRSTATSFTKRCTSAWPRERAGFKILKVA